MFEPSKKEIFLLKKHDEKTYDKLHKKYISYIKLYIKMKFDICSRDIATLAEDSFTRAAYEKIEVYDSNKSKFVTWLIRITHNLCLDFIKDRDRNQTNYSIDEATLGANDPNQTYLFTDLKLLLTDREYEIIVRYAIFNDSASDIAKDLNITRQSVHRTIREIKRKLKDY